MKGLLRLNKKSKKFLPGIAMRDYRAEDLPEKQIKRMLASGLWKLVPDKKKKDGE